MLELNSSMFVRYSSHCKSENRLTVYVILEIFLMV